MKEENGGTCHSFGEAGCGCCEGVQARTTRTTPNRPGKSALHYRIGRHADFLDTMKARFFSAKLIREPEAGAAAAPDREPNPLDGLRARDSNDPSIALLDAWATVADVLTFYQERIANEGYLRTATERRSVVELARLIGYRPRPGVAASLHLAYTIDENTNSEVTIPAGARSQSVPGPDELPQSFETSEPLAARRSWNELKPRKEHPPTWESLFSPDGVGAPSFDRLRVYLRGVSNNVSIGDPILINGVEGGPFLYRVVEVEADAPKDRSRVEMVPWEATARSEVAELVREVGAAIQALVDATPSGTKNAEEIGERLTDLQAVVRMLEHLQSDDFASLRPILEMISGDDGVLSDVMERRSGFTPQSASKLFPWMTTVAEVLTKVVGWIEAVTGGNAGTEQDADVERVRRLARRPAAPLPNATRLSRTLGENFGAKNDAAFKALAASHLELGDALSSAWANYEGASPVPELEVHALRLRSGLFGRGFPKLHISVRVGDNITASLPIGEWPIVNGLQDPDGVRVERVTESQHTLYLEGSHEGILPGSWIVLDFGALIDDAAKDRQVWPATFDPNGQFAAGAVLLTQVRRSDAKVSRAEYGGTGDTTRIQLGNDWIRILPKTPVPDTIVGHLNQGQSPGDQAIIDQDFQVIRRTTVYARSEKLELAEQPIETPVCFTSPAIDYIELDGFYADLEPGRFVIVSGERADIPETKGVRAAELAMIVDVVHSVRRLDTSAPLLGIEKPPDDDQDGNEFEGKSSANYNALPGDRVHTFIRLDQPLAYCYERSSLTIRANIVRATHGETRSEVLGSGDGSKPFASFQLKQRPLTYVSAPTPDGIESTLEVFVDGVRWKRVPDFVGRGPREHIYTVRTDNDDRTSVHFGDGHAGARAPTGVENVSAVYRSGIGRAGNVRAGQVSLLQSRPLGVRDVVNPLRASGGADRESRDQARSNAPLAVRALDRLVSVADYADFARTFAGIGKAVAAELSDGRQTVVHVTAAGADDAPIGLESDLFANLRKALREFGDAFQPIALDVRELLLLVIEARLKILPDHQWEVVSPAVRAALVQAFSFERRGLGQDVARSEIIAAIQAVRGVDWVDLDTFGAFSTSVPDSSAADALRPATPDEIGQAVRNLVNDQRDRPPRHRIPVELARPTGAGILPAQLAVLKPDLPSTLVLNLIT
jgi:hypothetical protein